MKFFFSFTMLLLCLCETGITAQNKVTLSGKVTDATGEPAIMATVAIEATTIGTYADEDGLYKLELSPGKYIITVSYFGYKTIRTDIEIKKDSNQDFILEDNTVNLNTVEVYGKTKTQQTRESAFTVNAIETASLKNTSASLNNMINRTTSVRIREEGGVGSDFSLSINGLSGYSVRYFIDGVPLSSLGSGITLANIPTNIVERIEMYKGVVPAHLGADALGGAINIITKLNRRDYLDVSYGAGSFNTHKSDINGQYIHQPSGFVVRPVVSINYSKNNYTMKGVEIWDEENSEYKKTDLKRFHDDYFSFLGQIEAGFVNRSWADALLFSGSISTENNNLQTGEKQSFVYGKARRERDSRSISAQYRKEEFLTRHLGVDASVAYIQNYSTTIDTAFRKYRWDGTYAETYRNEINGGAKSIRHYKRPRIIARTNMNYSIAPNHTVNFNYLLNSIKNNRRDELDKEFEPSEDVLTKHITGISYNQSLWNNKWTNNIFFKHYVNHLVVKQQDNSSRTGSKDMAGSSTTNYSGYGVGSRLELWRELSVKASYEHSIRLPMAMEFLGDGFRVFPNFKLKPENSNNYNLGVFGTWRPARNHLLFYEGGTFIREVKDFIHRVISEKEGLAQYENVSNVTIKGFEGELRYEYADLIQAIINCSYQDARSMTKYDRKGSTQITYKNKIPNQPWLFSNTELNLTLKDMIGKDTKVRFGYHYQYTHWFYLTWEGYGSLETKATIPTQHVHNASITCSFRKEQYNISLECNNLSDRILYDNYMLQKPGRAFFCKFRLFIN